MSKAKTQGFWAQKYPTQLIPYSGRPLPGSPTARVTQDVRSFITPTEFHLQKIADEIRFAGSRYEDDVALRCQKWVVDHLAYVSDETMGSPEFWLYPIETLARGQGDCEDGANLMATLAVMAGLDRWRIRVTCGDVIGGGHAYVTYCSVIDNEWRILDWCYWQDPTVQVRDKPLIVNAPKYYNGDRVWFSYTADAAYAPEQRSVAGRVGVAKG